MMGPEGFILTLGLAFSGIMEPKAEIKDSYFLAAKAAGEAAYIQTGFKKELQALLSDIERKYIPPEVLKYGSATVTVTRIVVEKKVTLIWEF
jgi:hypothetical protein